MNPTSAEQRAPTPPEKWTRLKMLFLGALDQSAEQREQWLRNAAAGDVELLHEAQALVEAHATAGTFLEEPPLVDPADLLEPAEAGPYVELGFAPGTRVGPYLILDELGRGGMGVVYLAEDQRLGRRVALKSVPPAAENDPIVRERLRREARAAATISHPAVAVV